MLDQYGRLLSINLSEGSSSNSGLYFLLCLQVNLDSWWPPELVLVVFLARFFRSRLPLLASQRRERVTQGHPAGFVPKAGLELMIPWFLAWFLNHDTKEAPEPTAKDA